MAGCSLWRCPGAKDDPAECNCSCRGRNHGARRGVRPQKAKDDADAEKDRKRAEREARQRLRLIPSRPQVVRAAGSGARSLCGTKGGALAVVIVLLFTIAAIVRAVSAFVEWLPVALAAVNTLAESVAVPLSATGVVVLVATQTDWHRVHAAVIRRRDVRRRRDDLLEQVAAERAPIAIGPADEIATPDEQEWINAGLR